MEREAGRIKRKNVLSFWSITEKKIYSNFKQFLFSIVLLLQFKKWIDEVFGEQRAGSKDSNAIF